jgi:hypothetical protein
MKIIALAQLIFLLLFLLPYASAQNTTCNWSYSSSKINDTTYDLIFHVDIKEGYVLFSRNQVYGSKSEKGIELNHFGPTFTFFKNDAIRLIRDIKHDKRTLGTYSNQVNFTQRICTKSKTQIVGELSYEIANSRWDSCQVITTPFVFILK